MTVPYRADTLAVAALAFALVLTATRRRPRSAVQRARPCTHTPPIGSCIAVAEAAAPVRPPVLMWCCELWWLTHGTDHTPDCPTGRSRAC
ncbi:hypothetical protein CTZ27_37025 [Streptomyces griseocarneus]|nr:hypothetical protein CTZ27_37025 [Streptomyces griseocarneus]